MRFTQAAACATAFILLLSATQSYATRPDGHAPIGVMGDHFHKQGEWMFSYRYMRMQMEDNRDGTDSLSPTEIATTIPKHIFGNPMQPPTLRVVPTEMTMEMHMLGVMYAPTDSLTLMAMVNYIRKDMDHTTFMGPQGDTVLGSFSTRTSGLGDTTLGALIRLSDKPSSRWHATLGVSLPTGDIEESDAILTPMNTRPSPRLPYPMQLGSGTYDLIAGLTYAGSRAGWGWGSQWRSVVRTGENDEDYTLGDEHGLSGWLSYQLNDRFSTSFRLTYLDRGNIDGRDPVIAAPVQTADPDRHGLKRLEGSLGLNVVLPKEHRVALELNKPLRQDLDGPQLKTDWSLTLGWQMPLGH